MGTNQSPISKWFTNTRDQAYALFDIMYSNTANNTGCKKEDLANAFVHAYVSATLSKKIGSTLALNLGYLKEIATRNDEISNFGGLLPAFLDTNRDLWNNQKGIEYAHKNFANDKELAHAIFEDVMSPNSNFIVDYLNDSRRWSQNATENNLWDIIKQSTFIMQAISESIKGYFLQAQSTQPIVVDPILLDLNGDGVIGTTALKDGVYFDHNGDKFAEKTSWVSKDDGILVIDKNNNGNIDNGSEIFGDNYVKSNGSKATSGFDALRDLDNNNDGVISAEDSEFSNIKILKGDGTLLTLEEAGITSISLSSTVKNEVDENGNTLVSSGSFVRSDGSVGSLGDFNLVVDRVDSVEVDKVEVSEEVSALPDVRGFGLVRSLHQAMMLDNSGELKRLVEGFVNSSSAAERRNIIGEILYKWSGADKASVSDGYHYKGKKLYVIEQFVGRKFIGINNDGHPNAWAAPLLDNCFNKISDYVYYSLGIQVDGELKSIYDLIELEYSFDDESVRYNFDKVIGYIDSVIEDNDGNGKDKLLEVTQIIRAFGFDKKDGYNEYVEHYSSMGEEYKNILDVVGKISIQGTEFDDNIEGTMSADAVFGGGGNDTIMSRQGDDLVYGGEGEDYIDACDGNDIVYGGAGNDSIMGGAGNDVLYGGDGNDSIDGGYGDDTIYGEGGDDVISAVGGSSTIYGGSGNDVINVKAHYNTIDGGDGNDTIKVEQGFGNSIIMGGKGDDVIEVEKYDSRYSGNVSAVYIYCLGDGNDVIKRTWPEIDDMLRFGEGITKDNIIFRGEERDLIIEFKDNEGSIRLEGALYGNSSSTVKKIAFRDGSVMDVMEIVEKGFSIRGDEGDNTIKGTIADDIIYGYGGNDSLLGDDGDDVIYGGEGNDTISGGRGHSLLYGGAGNDSIIGNYGNDTIYGEDGDDYINAGYGNDTIYGGNGNDTIISGSTNGYEYAYIEGGDGNDRIEILAGINTIVGGKGDDYIYTGSTSSLAVSFNGGCDQFIYNLGDGNDTINNYGPNDTDTLRFGEGITLDNILFRASGNDLIISFKDNEGSIRIEYGAMSNNTSYRIENYKFSDGTVLSYEGMMEIKRAQEEAATAGVQKQTESLGALDGDTAGLCELSDNGCDGDNGSLITNYDINKIIQDMAGYDTAEDAMMSYSDDINQEKELMTLVNSGV